MMIILIVMMTLVMINLMGWYCEVGVKEQQMIE